MSVSSRASGRLDLYPRRAGRVAAAAWSDDAPVRYCVQGSKHSLISGHVDRHTEITDLFPTLFHRHLHCCSLDSPASPITESVQTSTFATMPTPIDRAMNSRVSLSLRLHHQRSTVNTGLESLLRIHWVGSSCRCMVNLGSGHVPAA